MKTSAQLQREAAAQRAHLAAALDQLEDSMTARQIATEMMSLAKDSGVSIARSLAHGARDNPVPALLIGAGLLMMLTKGDGKDGDGKGLLGKAGDILKSAASSVGKTAGDVADAATDAVASAREGVEDAAGAVADRAKGATERGRDTADGLVGQAKDKTKHLVDEAQDLAEQGKTALAKLADEQPVLLAAAGAVLGAALGAALPVSDAERRYFGKASARVVRAGRDTAARVAGVVKEETLGDHPETRIAAVAEKAIRTVTKDINHPTGDRSLQSGGH